MRNYIDILNKLFEAKVVDGYWSSVSASELQLLVAQHGDLRGVADGSAIFIGRAMHNTHHSIRGDVGLMPLFGHDGNDEPHGFDFYVAPIEAHYEHEEGDEDAFEGRDDWGVTRAPLFEVGRVAVWASEDAKTCLTNPQFARMVKTR